MSSTHQPSPGRQSPRGWNTQVEEQATTRDAESRVCAVHALAAVACGLCADHGGALSTQTRQLLEAACEALLRAMEDYSTDSRSVVQHRRLCNAYSHACRPGITQKASAYLHVLPYCLVAPDLYLHGHLSGGLLSSVCNLVRTNTAFARLLPSALANKPSCDSPVDWSSLPRRGDVGSWVREAALESLARTAPLAAAALPLAEDPEGSLATIVPRTVGACLKQAVERIARVREVRPSVSYALYACATGC